MKRPIIKPIQKGDIYSSLFLIHNQIAIFIAHLWGKPILIVKPFSILAVRNALATLDAFSFRQVSLISDILGSPIVMLNSDEHLDFRRLQIQLL